MLWCLVTPVALGDDWPQWRGPDRNGYAKDASAYDGGVWPGKQLWRADVGEGGSSPIVAAGNVYTLGFDAKTSQDLVRCLDAATGAERWTHRYKSRRFGRHAIGDQGLYSGASATPEFDPSTKLLYTLGTDGDLNCWATDREGERVWGVNLYETFKAPRRPKADRTRAGQRDYGYITAPLVHGDWLLVAVGAAEGHLMAFDKRTGKRLWSSEARDPAGHCGGLAPITVEGKSCVAVLSINHLLVIRLDKGNEGRTLATYPWPTDFANNIASPAAVGNEVLITSGYNHKKMVKLRITASGAEKVWDSDEFSAICTPVIDGPHVYFVRRKMYCLDLATGRTLWSGGTFGDAASLVLTTDGRLICWTGNGDLTLVDSARLSPKSYRELASRKKLFRADAWPHVALADGRLYVKDRDGNLACVAVK